ncbi:PTAC2, partial [Symbiodinium pilosum]
SPMVPRPVPAKRALSGAMQGICCRGRSMKNCKWTSSPGIQSSVPMRSLQSGARWCHYWHSYARGVCNPRPLRTVPLSTHTKLRDFG